MKKTRSITTTVTVQPSDEVFVPRLGDVPNESETEKVRRQTRERFRRFYANEENRKRNIQSVIECRKRRLERIKGNA